MARPPLPPLNALRAFEATARHMSFQRAAEELHVTPPAVSHQIRALEEHLGFALFERLRRGIRLTEKGTSYFYRVSRALDGVAIATRDVRHADAQTQLTLAVPPHLLSSWMIPRLPGFLEQHPFLDLRIVDTLRQADFEAEGVDAQIYYGSGALPGVELEPLAEDDLCPVCSPAFLRSSGRIAGLRDLAKVALIHTERRPVSWERIFRSRGLEPPRPPRNLVFLHAGPVVGAAVHGMGVALANRLCIADLLASGALVIPFEFKPRPSPRLAYYLARPPRTQKDARIDLLRNWLTEEMARSMKMLAAP
jgi:LysR family glycine cleavage system transcriptional activator